MTERPRLPRAKEIAHAARDKRLAEALRENLRRRKEQARARAAKGGDRPDQPAGGGERPG